MHMFLYSVACFLLGVGVVPASKLPSYIDVCYRDDPSVNSCLLASSRKVLPRIVNGDPDIKLPSLDPLFVAEIKVKHGDDKFGLTIDIKNAKVYGLGRSVIKNILIDTVKQTGEMRLTVPKLTILTEYKVGGRVLILPIKGSGRGNFTMTNVTAVYFTPFELKEKADGEKHAFVYNSSIDFDMSRLYIHLDNLFDGNKLLGQSMNLFLNDNWKELVTVMKPTLSQTLLTLSNEIINSIGSALPYDDLFPPTAPPS